MNVFSSEYRPTLHRLSKHVQSIEGDGCGHIRRLVQHAVDTHRSIRAQERRPREKEREERVPTPEGGTVGQWGKTTVYSPTKRSERVPARKGPQIGRAVEQLRGIRNRSKLFDRTPLLSQ